MAGCAEVWPTPVSRVVCVWIGRLWLVLKLSCQDSMPKIKWGHAALYCLHNNTFRQILTNMYTGNSNNISQHTQALLCLTAVIKLNGGLGTSMGLEKAESMCNNIKI
jgi:hypothetical protein